MALFGLPVFLSRGYSPKDVLRVGHAIDLKVHNHMTACIASPFFRLNFSHGCFCGIIANEAESTRLTHRPVSQLKPIACGDFYDVYFSCLKFVSFVGIGLD